MTYLRYLSSLILTVIWLVCGYAYAQDRTDPEKIDAIIDNAEDAVAVRLSDGGSVTEKYPLEDKHEVSVQSIVNTINASAPTDIWRLALLDQDDKVLYVTTLDDDDSNRSNGSDLSGANVPALLINNECKVAASKWAGQIQRKEENAWVVVFNRYGNPCFRNSVGKKRKPERVTQGDPIYVGIIGDVTKTPTYQPDFANCNLQPSVPVFEDTLDGLNLIGQSGKSDGSKQSVRYGLYKFPVRECFNEVVVVDIRQPDGISVAKTEIRQYGRFRGSFHLGALFTDNQESTFSTIDIGDGPIIQESMTDDTGPEYFGSIVVYGLPRYLGTLGGDSKIYAGRDIINENEYQDRIGLVLSVGLSDPEEAFALGLSFELVPGINITANYLWRKNDILDGVSAGDAFAGSTIPTKSDWDADFVFGLSLDGRFLTRFFSGASEN